MVEVPKMPFAYDLPGIRSPKDTQLGLRLRVDGGSWSPPVNYSKKKSYLVQKMKEHRETMLSCGHENAFVEYQIIDADDNVLYSRTFSPGELP
jgi:hypothetical protein